MADEPTCPSLKPSVTTSLPAIRRIVVASDDGPAPNSTSAEITSKSNDRGYTCPTESNTRRKPR